MSSANVNDLTTVSPNLMPLRPQSSNPRRTGSIPILNKGAMTSPCFTPCSISNHEHILSPTYTLASPPSINLVKDTHCSPPLFFISHSNHDHFREGYAFRKSTKTHPPFPTSLC